MVHSDQVIIIAICMAAIAIIIGAALYYFRKNRQIDNLASKGEPLLINASV
jgi:hypothetical protein